MKKPLSIWLPYTSITLYVIEGRDKFWAWRPVRRTNGNIIVFDSKFAADECMLRHTQPKHPGTEILIKCKQRYRVRKIKLSQTTSRKSTAVTQGKSDIGIVR